VTFDPRVFPAVRLPGGPEPGDFERASITVAGLDHGGLSYELRVFVDHPAADARTALTGGEGYAGSIHVYGYGQPPPPDPGDGSDTAPAPAPTRIRQSRSIPATEAVRAAAGRAGRNGHVAITLVPVAVGGVAADVDLEDDEVAVQIDEGAGAA
jgi:hypothetical protein